MRRLFPVLILLFTAVTLFNCGGKEEEEKKKEKFILETQYRLPIPEPSGLCLSYDNETLWTVSDQNSTVYRLSLEGEILNSFTVAGIDLEGITVVNENMLAVVLERDREIVLLDTEGNELKRVRLDLVGEDNSGLEGITYNSNLGHYYILNEKHPRLLMELDGDLKLLRKTELDFSKDVSGIFYDKHENVIWILSDESIKLVKCDLMGKVLEEYSIVLPQIEGITISEDRKKLYIVSDNTENLYIYNIQGN